MGDTDREIGGSHKGIPGLESLALLALSVRLWSET